VTRRGDLTGRWLYDDLARKERNWVLTWVGFTGGFGSVLDTWPAHDF
jgi:hypothetical protein